MAAHETDPLLCAILLRLGDFLDWIDEELSNANKLLRYCQPGWRQVFPFPGADFCYKEKGGESIERNGYRVKPGTSIAIRLDPERLGLWSYAVSQKNICVLPEFRCTIMTGVSDRHIKKP